MTSARWSRPDPLIYVAAIGLVAIGLIAVFSASYTTAMREFGDPYYYIKRQSAWAAISLAAMFTVQRIDYRLLRPLALPGLVVAFGLLILVVLIGVEVGGSKAWLDLGVMRFQPSEASKLAIINFMAAYVAYRKEGLRKFWTGLVPALAILAVAFGLIMLEPDFGTAVAIAATVVIMLFAAGANLGHLAGIGLSGLPVLAFMVYTRPYRWRRITSFLDPWRDPLDSGWNVIQSLLAIGSGGLFGLGLGQGRQKFSYLPEQHTDFIFAVLAEELGFAGTVTVLGLFFLLAWRGYRAGLKAPDLFGSMLAVGITSMLVFQAMLNIGVATGSLPVTGITLPFLSSGGSSLLASCTGVGILLNISKAAESGVRE